MEKTIAFVDERPFFTVIFFCLVSEIRFLVLGDSLKPTIISLFGIGNDVCPVGKGRELIAACTILGKAININIAPKIVSADFKKIFMISFFLRLFSIINLY